MSRRRNVNQIFDPVLTVRISATSFKRLVYLLVANRPVRYGKASSRIVYIGTTAKGVLRIASSASKRIQQANTERLLRGLQRLDAHVVWARTKRGPQTKKGKSLWLILERALLMRFREQYGKPPLMNGTGQRMKERNEFDVFRRATIDRIISRYT